MMEYYQKIRFLNEVDQIIHLQPTPSELLTLLPFIQQDVFGALAYQVLECPFPNAACPQVCAWCVLAAQTKTPHAALNNLCPGKHLCGSR